MKDVYSHRDSMRVLFLVVDAKDVHLLSNINTEVKLLLIFICIFY